MYIFKPKRLLFFSLLYICINVGSACNTNKSKQVLISCKNPALSYMGRVGISDSPYVFYWSGTSVEMDFEGEQVNVTLKDETGNNYFYVILDGKPINKLQPDTSVHSYNLVTEPIVGKHTIQIFKLTEESHGRTWFYGFGINNGGKLLQKNSIKKRKIEFYGNSITSGYSIEDTTGDSKKPEFFNNYLTYAAIIARHYNSEYSCISKSGIGITVSWFPIIMPELYDRLDPLDSASKWDFSRFTPDIIVINLLSNDIVLYNKPQNKNFINRFGINIPNGAYVVAAYKSFILSLRNKYPNSYIICTLDDWMESMYNSNVWHNYINTATKSLNDSKILSYFFSYSHQNRKCHPKIKEHEELARGLINFIDANVK